MRTCFICGKESGKYKYCSDACKAKAHRERVKESSRLAAERVAARIIDDFGIDSNVVYEVAKLDDLKLTNHQRQVIADAMAWLVKGYHDKQRIADLKNRQIVELGVGALKDALNAKALS